ncbi:MULTISPECIES: hypothetical protein [unclassified Roseovarius]|uniref:hypothetical protein n=1 Tax=unclassified Roseovarius TaxID=2614913 RepID=UPI00273D31F9|nr:hypothetical protein [Roseovarius sp. MMSF_3350]
MSSDFLIAKSVILVLALGCGGVGLFALSDTFMTSQPGGAVDPEAPETDGASETTGPAMANGGGTALEREVAQRVSEHLTRLECREVTVRRVTATATIVPEEETSHGFEGHLLDGVVTLEGQSGPERIRLAGSGKGPTGAVSAVDMALREFGDRLKLTEIFEANCRGT